jgi:hypothetical protein
LLTKTQDRQEHFSPSNVAGPAGSAHCLRGKQARDSTVAPYHCGLADMTLGTILLIVLILVLIGAIPTWPYSSGWGYGPSGIVGVVLVIVLVLVLLGRV